MEIKSKLIEILKIEEIKPSPKNRNKHSKEQIERLAKIIQYQGFRIPLVISNRSGFLVAGNGRLEAAKLLGFKELPVTFQDFENEDQEYAAQVSDNAIAIWAELDFSGINLDLQNLGPDFDLDLLGLKDFSLDFSEKLILDETDREKDESKVTEHECPRCKYKW